MNENRQYFEGFKDGKNGKTATFTDNEAKAHKFVTGEDGTFTVVGLKSGNYELKEIKAPEGYRLPTNPSTSIQYRLVWIFFLLLDLLIHLMVIRLDFLLFYCTLFLIL
jgi:hypothetical protein